MSYEIKRRDNGILYVEFTGRDGKRKRPSLATRDMKIAEPLARQKFLAHFNGEDEDTTARPKPDLGFTLGKAVDKLKDSDWSPRLVKSWKSIWSDADILVRTIGDVPVDTITYDTIGEYIRKAQAEGHANGTIRKRLSRLKTLLSCCATKWINEETKRPYIGFVPAFPKVGKANVRKAELSEEDERLVYARCDELAATTTRGHDWWVFKQFIMWLIDTGMRKNECLGISERHIDGDTVNLFKGETKNDDAREIPMTARLQKSLGVFRSMDVGDRPFFASLSEGKVFEMWKQVRDDTGIGDVTIHDLRHTRGQRLYDADVPLEVIADLLGHRDIKVTASIYTQRKGKQLRRWTDHAESTTLRSVS